MREQYSTRLAMTAGALTLVVTAVFAFLQTPGLLDFPETAPVKSAGLIPHRIEGRDDCAGCHGLKGEKPYPVKHTGWSIGSCMQCHKPFAGTAAETDAPEITADETGTAVPMPHPVQGMERCSACHGPEADYPYPENHSGRSDDICTACHASPEDNKKN
ncbi:MAG: cytochrome c3 family protein [Desulfobulbaceae bacterium]|nr:cytochrome c3 family protein [Desulfobulbaceae bacterium]